MTTNNLQAATSTAPFVAIHAGREDPENHIGFIRTNGDGRFEAFDIDKVLLGPFAAFSPACDAIWSNCLGRAAADATNRAGTPPRVHSTRAQGNLELGAVEI